MKLLLVMVALVIATGGIRFAQAVPPGFEIEFEPQRQGKVIFRGEVHSGSGMYCADCHMEIFHVSRSAEITWRHHSQEAYCFTCHNGEMAFEPRRNCNQCHLDESE